MNWLVKSRHTGRVFYGFRHRNDAFLKAEEMNTMYQSDEYRVEAYDPAKVAL
jgi:hypothetical protein